MMDYVCLMLDRASMTELRRVWKLATTNKELSGLAVPLFTAKLNKIAELNGLPVSNSFEELYSHYRRRKIERRVKHKPKTWIKYYCGKGDLSAFKYFIANADPEDVDIHFEELTDIAGTQSLALVKEFISLVPDDVDWKGIIISYILKSAIIAGNSSVIEHLLPNTPKNMYGRILEAGCIKGDIGWVFFALQHTNINNWILRIAAKSGHKEIIDFVLTKVQSPINLLQGYMEGGRFDEVITLLNENKVTADDIGMAFAFAASSGNKKLIAYCNVLAGSLIQGDILGCVAERDVDTFKYVFGLRKWPKEFITSALHAAVYMENDEMARVLLEYGADPTGVEGLDHLLQGEV